MNTVSTIATLAGPRHWEPNSPASYRTTVSFTASATNGVMASGATAVTFDISHGANANGVVIGREFDIFGVPTVSPTEHTPAFLPGLGWANGNFAAQFAGTLGQHYRVEYTADLSAPNAWQVLTDIVSLATSPFAISASMTNNAGFHSAFWLP